MWWDHRPNSVESRLDATVLSAGKVVAGGRLNWGAVGCYPHLVPRGAKQGEVPHGAERYE